MKRILLAVIIIIPIILQGCTLASVNVEVMSERTALENQILGTYNALDREMLLAASVRGVDEKGQIKTPPKKSRGRRDAVEAMQILDFHSDDLRRFKDLGWVGENREGLTEVLGMEKKSIPEELKDFAEGIKKEELVSIVSHTNRARETIMQRVIDMNETLSDEDMSKIREIFAGMNAEKALPGDRIETGDGSWIVKE
ncbi:MAG: DUF1318 domain-containing protein [Deltaproteobacteria bacterium]|nr:DUF1318 domain-containing protein [Deltaproteobacteria bacterium]MBW2218238.1 DUF1318 domain-containing protein [Deltaproteobacteria bacterium]